jgi:acyl phosphate:glycerol-3-phosphate acyltransferase
MDYFVPLIVGYGVGSLPIGFVLTRWLRGVDLRQTGSGNVGATNVYRTAGLGLAIVVASVDVAKGVVSVLIASRLTSNVTAAVISGVAAIVGHLYPAWLRFRGGKGVATACGVFGLLAPVATLWAVAAFLFTVTATRYVSLGSIVASAALPPLAWATEAPVAVVAGGAVAGLLIIVKHRANLMRIVAGTERRLGQRLT